MGRLLWIIATALICLPSWSFLSELEGPNTLKQFRCKNGILIQLAWICDGYDDCGDNSDETHPECKLSASCRPDQFKCTIGGCIPMKFKCDGEKECTDGSDEFSEDCKTTKCDSDMFECEKGICIPQTWICDGKQDCSNGLDENTCNKTCSSKELMCNDGSCISKNFICDGDEDCTDGSDEKDCKITEECDKIIDFLCHDGSKCIPAKWRCDGDNDCGDKSDEIDCVKNHLSFCRINEFKCSDNKMCIHESLVCDGIEDCRQGEDEDKDLCSNSTCPLSQFECKDKTCIPGYLHCDGVANCPDQSDEENCHREEQFNCLPEEFDCGSGLCINFSRTCDGLKDCPNGEDEDKRKCGVDECKFDNGGCDHKCVDMKFGHKCECREGYKLIGNSTCEDINECNIYGSCSHNCKNEIGSYSCSCFEGYVQVPNDHRRCKAIDNGARLIYTRRTEILSTNLDGDDTTVLISGTRVSKALDFDYKSGFLFWSESTETNVNQIYRAHLSSVTSKLRIIENVNLTDDIAVDWIYNHIYWTDTGKNTVEVANFDGTMKKVLVNEDLDEPRAIAVDPIEGWLFWSDWGKVGKIERSELDGSNRITLVTNTLKWPNGIALDLVQHKLYWVDAKLNSIYSVNYDGSMRKEVKHSPHALHHPFSLTLFEDRIFWTDWDNQAIYRADKFDGSNMTNIMSQRILHNPMVIHVHHPYRQPKSVNHCQDTKCSHFCFAKPNSLLATNKYTCGCPDGLKLLPDKSKCDLIMAAPTETSQVPTKPPKIRPPIVIDFEPGVEATRQIDQALLIILILAGVVLLIVFIAFLSLVLYRLYLNGNIKIMNFDNPMYKKAATRDAYSPYKIEAQISYPQTPNEEVHQPLTSTITMESAVYQ